MSGKKLLNSTRDHTLDQTRFDGYVATLTKLMKRPANGRADSFSHTSARWRGRNTELVVSMTMRASLPAEFCLQVKIPNCVGEDFFLLIDLEKLEDIDLTRAVRQFNVNEGLDS